MSSSGLPNQEPPIARVTRKKMFTVAAENQHWDFLKGSGPAAPPKMLSDTPKDNAFKPNWKVKKPAHAIDPHRDSISTHTRREERAGRVLEQRRVILRDRDFIGGLDVVSGEERYNPPKNPAKPHGTKYLPERPAEHFVKQEAHETSRQARIELRKEVIRSEGLRPGRKTVGVADNFDPYH